MINLKQAIEITEKICEKKYKDYIIIGADSYDNYFYIWTEPKNNQIVFGDNRIIVKINRNNEKYEITDFIGLLDNDDYFDKRIELDISNI